MKIPIRVYKVYTIGLMMEEFKNYKYDIPFTNLKDGKHTIYYYGKDYVGNESKVDSFSVYFDRTAPIMSSGILGDKFIVNEKVFFSGRTKLKLTAIDNKAGVKEVLYSINDEEFKPYNEPFYLPSIQGEYIVKYYAIDKVKNAGVFSGGKNVGIETMRYSVNRIYVDLTGPKLYYRFIGRKIAFEDTTYIGANTKIRLSAKDEESGLKKINYVLNNGQDELLYETPFTVKEAGYYKMDYIGYDNVNNRNIKTTYFMVDDAGPSIYVHFSAPPIEEKDGVETYQDKIKIYLGATDDKVGTQSIQYQLNSGKIQPYVDVVDGLESGKSYTIKIFSKDRLDNESTKEVSFKIK